MCASRVPGWQWLLRPKPLDFFAACRDAIAAIDHEASQSGYEAAANVQAHKRRRALLLESLGGVRFVVDNETERRD